jgi:hypothetical protein
MKIPKIYADYGKIDFEGRLILVCRGTLEDLKNNNIELETGLELTFYMDSDIDDLGNPDDLLVDGIVEFDDKHERWVAKIDERTYRHESDIGRH